MAKSIEAVLEPKTNHHFLIGGGLAAEIIREKNWSESEVGEIHSWPETLRIALGIMLKSKIPMFVSWGKSRTFFYNDAYGVILGNKHPSALGKKFEDVWSDIWTDIEPLVLEIDKGESVYLEDLRLTMNRFGFSEETFFTFSYSPIYDETGAVSGLFCSVVETTQRVQAELSARRSIEETRRSENELIDTLESMSDAFFSLDKDWRVTRVNRQHETLTKKGRDEQIGKSLIDLWFNDPKYEDSLYLKSYRKVMNERVAITFEDYYDPLKFWTEVRVYPKSDGGIAVFFTDITERKVTSIALAESSERYRLLFESSPLPKWIFDIETLEFLDVNETAIKHYGYSREEFLSMKVTDIRPKEDIERFETVTAAEHENNRTYHHKNFRHLKKDGTIIWVDPSTHDLTLNGRKARLAAIVDVTERVKSDERQLALLNELKTAKDEAERANQLKSAFLANMSHEIRTPLGAMMGFADLLKDPGLTVSERQSFTNILSRNGESLSVIINDILDLSKVEAGHLTLEYTDTFPDQIGADVVSLLRVKANEKDLVLEYSHDESSPASVVADPTRVRQILLNIVGNAIKFTQFGSIHLRSFACKTNRGRDALCFEVKDTGIGIPKAQQENIFEMFVQADGSMTRRFGGTGLGLALSRHLARAMGGDVVITETNEGIGSTFLVTIEDQPERRNESTVRGLRGSMHSEELPAMSLDGIKILVVDDAPDNQQLIWRYLTKQGAVVDSAENGFLGYRAALAGNFDLILMDIQMPIMDGYSATQKLREAGYRKPIVALTAHAMSEVRKKALNVGYTDHLTKPINSKELISTIAKHVRGA